jgi:hypothetical protein
MRVRVCAAEGRGDGRLQGTLYTTHYTLRTTHYAPTIHSLYTPCGFKRSFFPQQYSEKRKFVRQIMNYYAKLEKEYGLV